MQRKLEALSWALWPAGSAFVVLLLAAFPQRILLLPELLFLLPLTCVHYWRVFRPTLMPYWVILLLGVVQDALFGLPIGLTGFLYVLYALLLGSQRVLFVRETFLAVWFGFAVLSSGFALSQAGMLYWLEHTPPPWRTILAVWLTTLCFYPLMHVLFNKVYASLPSPAPHRMV